MNYLFATVIAILCTGLVVGMVMALRDVFHGEDDHDEDDHDDDET